MNHDLNFYSGIIDSSSSPTATKKSDDEPADDGPHPELQEIEKEKNMKKTPHPFHPTGILCTNETNRSQKRERE